MKKKIILLSLIVTSTVILFSAGNTSASAYIDTPHDILSDELIGNTVDYKLWDNFIKYDLCITDYDSLTDEEKELCEFIFETERSAVYSIRCERARRIVAGENVGERVSLDDLIGAYGIWDKYSYGKVGNFKYIQCVPDIVATDSPNIYNEYWFDDDGKYGVRFAGQNYAIYEQWQDFVLCGDYTLDDYAELYGKYHDINNLTYEQYYRIDTLDLPKISCTYDEITNRNYFTYTGYIEYDGNYYYITSENTAVLIGSSMKSTESPSNISPYEQPVIIPKRINDCDVVAIDRDAFANSPVTEIILPDTIKFIETGAFHGCIYLEKINFPKGLEHIGQSAFADCNISNLYIDCPDLYISPYAFYMLNTLERAYINVKTIGENAFKYCKNLEQLELGEAVERIEAYAFQNCLLMENFNVPPNVKIIGTGAFLGNGNMKSVKISAETEIIGAYAEALGSPNTSGIYIEPTDPLTEEALCAFDSDCVISGWYGTEAHSYALQNNLAFVALDENVAHGDTNKDGSVDVSDAVMLQRYLIKLDDSIGYEADVNKDGRINAFDMVKFKKQINAEQNIF